MEIEQLRLSIELSHNVKTGCVEYAIELLKKGANVNYIDHNNISIIEHAIIAKQHNQITNLKKYDINLDLVQDVFVEAIISNNLEIVKCCVEYCNVNYNIISDKFECHNDKHAPLAWVISKNYMDLFVYLVNLPNININITSKYNKTPLRIASAYSHGFLYLTILLSKGANLKIYGDDGMGPLIRSITNGKTHNAMQLLQYCDLEEINHQDSVGKTAIMYAIEKNNKWVSQFLVYNGADLTIRCNAVFDYASKYGSEKKFNYLVNTLKINKELEYQKINKEFESQKILDDQNKTADILESVPTPQIFVPDVVVEEKNIEHTINSTKINLIVGVGFGNQQFLVQDEILFEYIDDGQTSFVHKLKNDNEYNVIFHMMNLYHIHPDNELKIKIKHEKIIYL